MLEAGNGNDFTSVARALGASNARVAQSKQDVAFEACNFGHVDILKAALMYNVDVNAFAGRTCAHTTVQGHKVSGLTLLHVACYNGHKDCVSLLCRTAGVLPNLTTRGPVSTISPLAVACAHGNVGCVLALLSHADLDLNPRTHQVLPLHVACKNDMVAIVVALVGDLRTDLNIVSCNPNESSRTTPLICAAQNGNERCVAALIADRRIEIDKSGDDNMTALMMACLKGHIKCVDALVAAGANCTRRTASGVPGCRTALDFACANGHIDCARSLHAAMTGVQFAAVVASDFDPTGWTTLHTACMWGTSGVECAELLLGSGHVDVNAMTTSGHTPLMISCENGNAAVARLLVGAGADPDLQTHFRGAPIGAVVCSANSACLEILLACPGINPNVCSVRGDTPLTVAVTHGHQRCAKLLLAAPNVDIRSGGLSSRTPIRAARNNAEMLKRVVIAGGDRFCRESCISDGVAFADKLKAVYKTGIDYWDRRYHGFHAHSMKQVVATILLVRQRAAHGCGPGVSALPPLPVEIWMLVLRFLRGADAPVRL